jgi:hypothetical protein
MVRNITLLILVGALAGIAIIVGSFRHRSSAPGPSQEQTADIGVPHIGKVQVLNGTGVSGVGRTVADFLRTKGFDVRTTGNAPTANYECTMVVSRTGDMANAKKIALALATDKVLMMRDSLSIYDVDVFIGKDWTERIK